MKKCILAVFVTIIAAAAMAQGPGKPGGMGGQGGGRHRMDPKAQLAKMTKDLGLTPVQQKKIEGMMSHRSAEMEKLLKAPGDMNSKRPQFKKMMEGFNDSLKTVLTKTQEAKYEAMRKANRSRMGGGGGRPGGPPPGNKGGA